MNNKTPVTVLRIYDSPSLGSRLVMSTGDILTHVLVPLRPAPRLPLHKEQTKKLLLLRLDGIGDNICSWPALKFLREHLPHCRIVLAVGPWAAPLYRECPWVDEVIQWDSGLFGMFRGKGFWGLGTDLRLARLLRRQGFDAGIDLRGDALSIFLLWLIAPPVRIGQSMRGGGRLLTDPLQIFHGHETERVLNVALAATGLPSGPPPRLRDWSRPQALAKVGKRLAAAGWDSSRPTAAICAGALWPWKQWPRERFRELAVRLESELNLQVIWIMEQAELWESDAGGIMFSGQLDEVAAVLGLCRLAICSDSGLLHLAVAVGCNTVQLFGPGDAARFAHIGEGLVVHHDRSCSDYPCVQRGTCSSIASGWCLDKISVDDVFASCQRLMAASSARARDLTVG